MFSRSLRTDTLVLVLKELTTAADALGNIAKYIADELMARDGNASAASESEEDEDNGMCLITCLNSTDISIIEDGTNGADSSIDADTSMENSDELANRNVNTV